MLRRWPWLVLPLFGAALAAIQLRHTYFFYDEWSMIERVLHVPPGEGTLASFNGHLWMLQYWLYRAQVFWFGVDTHTFISAVFVCSLVMLHLSLAALLKASGLSTLTSLLLGGLLTYLGPASQNFIFAIQTSPALSLAASLAAAGIALAHPASSRRCFVAGTLMLLSVGIDTGAAIVGIPIAAVVLARSWGRVSAVVVVPSGLALGWWYATASLGPSFPATLQERAAFGGRLLLHAAGAVIGGGEIAGVAVLLLSGAIIGVGVRQRDVGGPAVTMLIAGAAATVLVTVGLAQSRAGLRGFSFIEFNRYLQNVAIPLTLALAPALAMSLRGLVRRVGLEHNRVLAGAAPALIVVAFILGYSSMRAYVTIFQDRNLATRRGVQSAYVVIRDGCPSGEGPSLSSKPLDNLSPQISTQLLRELILRGSLHLTSPVPPDPAVTGRMCPK